MLPIQPNAVPATITEGCAGRPVRLFDPLAVMTVVVIVEDAALLVAVDVKKDGVVGRVRSHGRCLLRRRPWRGTQPAATLQHTRTFVRSRGPVGGSLMTPRLRLEGRQKGREHLIDHLTQASQERDDRPRDDHAVFYKYDVARFDIHIRPRHVSCRYLCAVFQQGRNAPKRPGVVGRERTARSASGRRRHKLDRFVLVGAVHVVTRVLFCLPSAESPAHADAAS
jgi:hypothetical protein